MPSGRELTDADRWHILTLLETGMHYRQIARRLELHRTTVSAVVRGAAVAWFRWQRDTERLDRLRERGE